MTGCCVQCLCPELRWPRLTVQSEAILAVSWLWLPSVSLPLTTSVLSHPPSCRILRGRCLIIIGMSVHYFAFLDPEKMLQRET